MYAAPITEEDSFLPAVLWSDPTEQLERVRGYYERQRKHNLVLDRSLEDIRMSYSMRLCTERNRLSKSLWELEVRKRRLLHQIMEPQAKRSSDWRRTSVSEARKQRLKEIDKEQGSVMDTGQRNKRTSTKRKEGKHEKTKQRKTKIESGEKTECEQLEIPKYLLQ